ncbi:aldose epimerase family protein [Mucilaginibacter lappiensis]|uniref:Aldose 1-epimerase n=1 Tax=Mucilaginibacter lappiensis TaxID=354630 RepID=A0A841JH07_9SPHI|nr:aldose epimerase family protein [Mucilaginibacter lappiensis]MBB6127321.1 aldose 1-epimerase [Mucilaginibacter lappiensis]
MNKSTTQITHQEWGQHAGEPVYLFKMENTHGAYVELTNYGATLVSVVVPDARGVYSNVVLGFPSLQGYLDDSCYIGSTIGRYANRIGGASFKLDSATWQLENNDGENTNHGGNHGFNTRVFKYAITAEGLFFILQSPDGEGGYPGNLELTVHYQWRDLNELAITYYASTDKRTIANFTNHAYFNLSNNGAKIFDHTLTVHAGSMLQNGTGYIPTGLIEPVGSRKFSNTAIRSKMLVNETYITGLNDCYILDEQPGTYHKLAAELTEKKSGRKLEIFTTCPSLIVYTGDYLLSEHSGHRGERYSPFDGICLECQYYPDSPNHPNFPATVLSPGDTYQESIIYKFGTI